MQSHYLFGPRQTGKSTLIRQTLGDDCAFYDLLDSRVLGELAAQPWLLRERLQPHQKIVVIDEVQKLPRILDEVHLLIERDPELRFLLSGSSARKLMRGGQAGRETNLLGGRVWLTMLHPYVSAELNFEGWQERLAYGSLPGVLDSPDPWRHLAAYTSLYLQEEVRAEGLVRSIENFSRFLHTAGYTNGEQVNFTKIGSDAAVPSRTVREYYQVLIDTLIGFYLEPWRDGKRKAVATPKFYFFDVGVANRLVGRRELPPGTSEYGRALEHQIILEVRAYLTYRQRLDVPMRYWRTKEQYEVDLIVGGEVAIEVKGKAFVPDRDLKCLRLIAEEGAWRRRIVVCDEKARRRTGDGIEIWPVEEFLRALWGGEILR